MAHFIPSKYSGVPAVQDFNNYTQQRDFQGCLNCRIRAKKCPNPQTSFSSSPPPCDECLQKGYECLGYPGRMPAWARTARGEALKNEMKQFTVRNGRGRGTPSKTLSLRHHITDTHDDPALEGTIQPERPLGLVSGTSRNFGDLSKADDKTSAQRRRSEVNLPQDRGRSGIALMPRQEVPRIVSSSLRDSKPGAQDIFARSTRYSQSPPPPYSLSTSQRYSTPLSPHAMLQGSSSLRPSPVHTTRHLHSDSPHPSTPQLQGSPSLRQTSLTRAVRYPQGTLLGDLQSTTTLGSISQHSRMPSTRPFLQDSLLDTPLLPSFTLPVAPSHILVAFGLFFAWTSSSVAHRSFLS
ncbi:hypothetical protein DL93DRAFT_2153832 [Clavulina sp. PMI_390]|nr:hypothetical protein DL93DRAFT_2153832 [Clavulina sp. PMI_390]